MTKVPNQLEKFKETARVLGCDEDKERFEATLGKIAKYKPTQREVGKGGKKKSK